MCGPEVRYKKAMRLWKTCSFLWHLAKKPREQVGGFWGGGVEGAAVTPRGGSMFKTWVFFNVQHGKNLFLGVEAVCILIKQLFGKCSSNVQSDVRDAENECSAHVQNMCNLFSELKGWDEFDPGYLS